MNNTTALAKVERAGFASLQDCGRPGWLRLGVPHSGWMDPYAAGMALRLVASRTADAVLIEVAHLGFQLQMQMEACVAIAGADTVESYPAWRCHQLQAGDRLNFANRCDGQWTYLAFDCGIRAQRWLGSVSVNPTAGMGALLKRGDLLYPAHAVGTGGINDRKRFIRQDLIPNYGENPILSTHPATQSDWFEARQRDAFYDTGWQISPSSNRMGIRLQGPPLAVPKRSLLSEPVRVGSIQVPPDGQPIVMGPDGPTVGGYPKIGWIAPAELAQLAQCRPGQTVRFCPSKQILQ
jgi:biotin-dependent carboxylase-like uncharacterized protein